MLKFNLLMMLDVSDKQQVTEIILTLKIVILVGVNKLQMSAEHNISSAVPLLQSPNFKFMNDLKKVFGNDFKCASSHFTHHRPEVCRRTYHMV
jgi:hypothetical protein